MLPLHPIDPEMECRPNLQAYRRLEVRMASVRAKNLGADSSEEDAVLDELDVAWWAMAQHERDYINSVLSPNHEALVKWLPGGA